MDQSRQPAEIEKNPISFQPPQRSFSNPRQEIKLPGASTQDGIKKSFFAG
jgi:hypothetical protein